MHQVDSLHVVQATLIAELIYASYAVHDVCVHHLNRRIMHIHSVPKLH